MSLGKTLTIDWQQRFQLTPVETWTWVKFSSGRNMLVSRNVGDGVVLNEITAQCGHSGVLDGFEKLTLKPFEFNADAVIVAVVAPSVVRLPGMPGPVVATDKLPEGAITPDKKMRRDLEPLDLLEVGM